jgi:hypothetical protein
MENGGCGLRRDVANFAAHMDILPPLFEVLRLPLKTENRKLKTK